MEMVGQADDHELDLAVGAEVLHGRVLAGHAVAMPELLRPLLGARVVGDDLRVPDVAQAVHVEVGDESGTEHADAHRAAHGWTPAAAAFLALNSSSIAAVCVAPTRVTPISRD